MKNIINKNYKNYKKQTQRVRGGLMRSKHGETSEAIFMNSGYVFNSAEEAKARFAGELDGYLYSRHGNPTVTMFEERMAINEEAEACFATASGMAAVFASFVSYLKSGDEVVASQALFGSCFHVLDQILPRYGVITHLIDGTDLSQWEQYITDKTKMIIINNPNNPTGKVYSLEELSYIYQLAKKYKLYVLSDEAYSDFVIDQNEFISFANLDTEKSIPLQGTFPIIKDKLSVN